MSPKPGILVPPTYCQVAGGPCDQTFGDVKLARGVFLYASGPTEIAGTIEGAVRLLQYHHSQSVWKTWKDFGVSSQVIFNQICKAIRFSDVVFADVSTLNFNVMFEIGFALGLGQPTVPIRDTSWIQHKLEFDQLGLLDTIGNIAFSNGEQLSRQVYERWHEFKALPSISVAPNLSQPVYVVKGPISTDGEIHLLSVLKKSMSFLRLRTFDVIETPRLSLHEVRRQVFSSLGVVAHLFNPNREGSLVHNARAALVAGMATAANRIVLLASEGAWSQPIDYRDLVHSYVNKDQLSRGIEPFIRAVFDKLQDAHVQSAPRPERMLERLNLGDVAAENEIQALKTYFVRTAQFSDAKRGTARLLTGRKGAGKTAIFYAVREAVSRGHGTLVLDLKPEGYQFTKLKEFVLTELTEGLQEHTLSAFWHYILLCELAQKILTSDHRWAERDPDRWQHFEHLSEVYTRQPSAEIGDFSERLLRLVDVLVERFAARDSDQKITGGLITSTLFRGGIRELEEALAPYLAEKADVWVLLDNLDKGWPTRGARATDILIIRSLLEATRKLQRQLEQREVGFHALLCLRNDIYELLMRDIPDRGKDTAISLDYDDVELFKEIVRQRMLYSSGFQSGTFEQMWSGAFPAQVCAQDAFQYIISRTLMRPRDLLNFLHRATEVAINRGHDRVSEDDVLAAEKRYSEDILTDMTFELRDTYPEFENLLYTFIGAPTRLSKESAIALIEQAAIANGEPQRILEVLVWFGFLGVVMIGRDEAQYAYQVRYNVEKLLAPLRTGGELVIHPAFRQALDAR